MRFSKKNIIILVIVVLALAWLGFFSLNQDKPLLNITPRLTQEEITKATEQRLKAQEMIQQEPNNVEKLIHLAILQVSLGELEEAKQTYLRAVALEPENYIPYLNLGTVLSENGYAKKAEKVLRQGLKKIPQGAAMWQILLDTYQYGMKKNQEQMQALFQEALSATGRDLNLMLRIARYYEENKKVPAAIPYWQEVLQKMPDNEAVRARLKELKVLP